MHLMFYLASVAAPFPFLRLPGFLGPLLFSASTCYQMVSSPPMLVVAFQMEGGDNLPQTTLWVMLAVAMVTTLVGAILMACFMVPEYRSTFYKVLRPIELV